MLVLITVHMLKSSSHVINLPVFENEFQIIFKLSRFFEVYNKRGINNGLRKKKKEDKAKMNYGE